jgi:hypothetical protein
VRRHEAQRVGRRLELAVRVIGRVGPGPRRLGHGGRPVGPRKPFDVLAKGLSVPLSRGDWRSFEPLIAAIADAALSPTPETIVATRVVRLSA